MMQHCQIVRETPVTNITKDKSEKIIWPRQKTWT
jgi:hypothetical protein